MNLNESIRAAFVASILNDVPQVDYIEQMRELIQKDAKSKVPPDLLKKENVEWLNRDEKAYSYSGEWEGEGYCDRIHVFVPCMAGGEHVLSPEAQQKLDELLMANDAQGTMLRNMRNKLMSAAAAFRTVKQLREAMPEFAKYLPTIDNKTANLPVIANIKEELTAAGWPKDK